MVASPPSAQELQDRYGILVAELRSIVEGDLSPADQISAFHELCAKLPDDATDLPLVEQTASDANLLEPLLLAAASLGIQPTDDLLTSAIATRSLGANAPWRLGHTILRRDADGPDAEIHPILASMLHVDVSDGLQKIRAHAADLGWDRVLQKAATETTTSAALARLALGSPARWLARSPEALKHLGTPAATEPRPADDSAARLLATAGATKDETTAIRAVPGVKQRPSTEPKLPLVELLDRLETSPTAWQWSDAIVELLAREPTGIIAGVEIDLRRLIAAHVASFFTTTRREFRRAPERGFRRADWLRFEIATLKHGLVLADRTVAQEDVPCRVRAAWLYGDWIGRVLRESPFLGADPELLAARVEASLPATLPTTRDTLWPSHVGTSETSLRLDELWMMHALLSARASWKPPGPVLDALRVCANRTLNAAEEEAETTLARGCDVLEWPGPHIAPPLVARWLLYFYQAEWFAVLKEAAQNETMDWLERFLLSSKNAPEKPERGAWIMLSLFRDAAKLGHLRARSISLWTSAAQKGEAHAEVLAPLCLWGATLLPELPPEGAARLLPLAKRTPPRWRPGVLMTLAHSPEPEIARGALNMLLELVGGDDVSLRLPSAITITQLARKLPPQERNRLLDDALGRMSDELRAQPSLRVELMRVGRTP